MIMSKEIQLLRSRMKFYKTLINELDNLNFITKSNNFDKKIEEYCRIQRSWATESLRRNGTANKTQDSFIIIYKRVQEIKMEGNK